MDRGEAIKLSIQKYRRMIHWAQARPPTDPSSPKTMRDGLGIAWFADDCPLCEKYMNTEDERCKYCPLKQYTQRCEYPDSFWWEMQASNIWTEWITAATKLLGHLLFIYKIEFKEDL